MYVCMFVSIHVYVRNIYIYIYIYIQPTKERDGECSKNKSSSLDQALILVKRRTILGVLGARQARRFESCKRGSAGCVGRVGGIEREVVRPVEVGVAVALGDASRA